MAAAGNIGPLVMAALQARSGGGGATGMPGGEDSGQQYAAEYASLKGADPGMLLREVKQMKQQAATLMVQNLERLPNVAGQLAKLIPQYDRIIKEIQQAASVQSAARPPLGMGAAMPPAETPGGGLG